MRSSPRHASRSADPLLTIVPHLGQLNIFKGFSTAELERLQKHCSYQVFHPGEALFEEGNPLINVFFMLKGHVKFCKKESKEKEITFSLFGEGDIFELMMSNQPENHLFSAYALSETTVLKVSPADFRKHFMGNIGFANDILYQKIRTIKRLYFSRLASGEPVEVRMACLILDILQRPGMARQVGKTVQLDISLTRRDIAEIVNTSVETSIRVIRKWIKRGLVTMTRRHLVLQDAGTFKKIVGKLPQLPD
ncbi:MAG TPA: Crp/Fnr family transcriptional regulator [bacterium]|jgi:CRP-like cAMP-binding protein|nr:Crp/Fnr family transcriptional regulator [bacterium]